MGRDLGRDSMGGWLEQLKLISVLRALSVHLLAQYYYKLRV